MVVVAERVSSLKRPSHARTENQDTSTGASVRPSDIWRNMFVRSCVWKKNRKETLPDSGFRTGPPSQISLTHPRECISDTCIDQ